MAEFMQGNSNSGMWVSDAPEPTIIGGSPPFRRPGRRGAALPEGELRRRYGSLESGELSPDMKPHPMPKCAVTDEHLRKAFGPSPLFGGSAASDDKQPVPTPVQREDSYETKQIIENLKNLSVAQIIEHFKGDASSTMPPSPAPSPPFDDSPWRRSPVLWPPIPQCSRPQANYAAAAMRGALSPVETLSPFF